LIGRCRGKTHHKQAKSVGAVCHGHHVGGYRVTRLFALDLASSGIKRYVQRVLVLDAGNASVHAACSLTASESCI
jgi:hypothetical protein